MLMERRTVVAYESPNRLLDTLAEIQQSLGERKICVARELSKIYEEFVRGTTAEVLAHFTANPPRGEIVLVIGGTAADARLWTAAEVERALDVLLDSGESLSHAAKQIAAESGWKRREVYALKTNPGKNAEN
jgi:16S rRNA (cytidine1402-2'-O)-methyltransferase